MLVSIGNGLYAHTKQRTSLLEEYKLRQKTCPHTRRDPRGTCYHCGHSDKCGCVMAHGNGDGRNEVELADPKCLICEGTGHENPEILRLANTLAAERHNGAAFYALSDGQQKDIAAQAEDAWRNDLEF